MVLDPSTPEPVPEPPYTNAPIVEAVIDFRTVGSDADLKMLGRVNDSVRSEYPKIQGRFNIESTVNVDDASVSTRTDRTQIGHVFSSKDEVQIFHSRRDGFSFSRMKPYQTWEPFQAEALKLWENYYSVVAPSAVTRVGVRYINRIELPGTDPVDLKHFFRTGPEIAPDLPQNIEQYLFTLQMPLPEHHCRLNLTSAIVDRESNKTPAIVLDIDVWRSTHIALDGPMTEALIDIMSELRQAKNKVFESSITDDTRRLFI